MDNDYPVVEQATAAPGELRNVRRREKWSGSTSGSLESFGSGEVRRYLDELVADCAKHTAATNLGPITVTILIECEADCG